MPLANLILIALIPGLAALVVVLIALWRRSGTSPEISAAIQQINEQASANKTAIEMLDQRLGQITQQFTQSHHELSEVTATRFETQRHIISEQLVDNRNRTTQLFAELREQLQTTAGEQRTRVEEQHGRTLKALQDSMQSGYASLHKQLGESLLRNATETGQRLEVLAKVTDERLQSIAGQVDKRLSDGFEKTTATFTDVVKRLALIDEAQKKITALSTEVVGLQQLLADKRSRGAFGEVQLASLVENIMPPGNFALQHTLSNQKIADCVLFLPEPTGTICIDAKFPLESYRIMTDLEREAGERKQAETQFKQDIKKHIRDIAEKYIIRNVTADGALMFIPAEAVFAEIQAHHPELVEAAHAQRVWLASPTTLWAILNTASAVIKDAATREQVDIIQQHLGHLAGDFDRFRTRMDKLSRHIQQANDDVGEVSISARKIADRFEKIERVELEAPEDPQKQLGSSD